MVFWRVATVFLILALFYVGAGLRDEPSALPGLESSVLASGVSSATDDVETIITAGNDGKTIYVWRYYGSKPPKYLGKSEARVDR